MTTETADFRTKTSFSYEQHRDFYEYLAGFAILLVGIFIGAQIFGSGYDTNVYTELLSVVATVLILDKRAERREQRRRDIEKAQDLQRQLAKTKAHLLREVASTDNTIALRALRVIKERGWLRGNEAILQDADLRDANLSGANLSHTNLSDTKMVGINLSRANLDFCDLYYASMGNANLSGASFWTANLSGAFLQGANLSGASISGRMSEAYLEFADLSGAFLDADLSDAFLQDADLRQAYVGEAKFNQETILPNGKNWTPDTDMTQFGCFLDEGKYWEWYKSQGQGKQTV